MFDLASMVAPASATATLSGGAPATATPAVAAAPAAPPASGLYTVASGDTLSGIAAAHGTTVAALQALNPNIVDVNKIQAGQAINLNALGSTNGAGSSPLSAAAVSSLSKGAGSVPAPHQPLPADALSGTTSTDLSAILGRAVNGGTTSSDIAGLLAALEARPSSSSTIDKLGGQISALESSQAGEGDDLTAALGAAGVPDTQRQVADLNVQAAQLKGSIAAFDAETAAGLTKFSNQPITTGAVSNEQATYQKGRDLTKLAMTAQLTAATSLITAYNGNIDAATKMATQAVDLKYQGISNQITALKDQLSEAKDTFTRDDTKQTTIVGDVLKLAENNLTVQANNEKQIQTIAVQAAANGAPLTVVNAIRSSPDPASAATAAGSFTKGGASGSTGAITTGGAGVGTFTATQSNTGAANAGVPLATFDAYDPDTKNTFINGDIKGTKKSIDDAFTSGKSLDDINQGVVDLGLTPTVTAYFQAYAQSKAPKPGWGSSLWNYITGGK